MIYVCAYCKKVMRPEDGVEPVGAISRGCCPECAVKVREACKPRLKDRYVCEPHMGWGPFWMCHDGLD